jgi:hypothetical protein
MHTTPSLIQSAVVEDEEDGPVISGKMKKTL